MKTNQPLLAPEDSGGAAGGISASATTTSDQGEPATAPAGTGEKLLSQTQVNALIASARREGRESAGRETPKPAAPKGEAGSMELRLEEMEMRRTFDRRASKLGLDDEASDDLFDLYKAQRPSDLGAWFDGKAARFTSKGTVSQPPSILNQPNAEAAKPPAAAPSTSQPAAVNPITTGGLVDIFNLTPEQFATFTPLQLREQHEKNVASARSRAGAPPPPRMGPKR